jgi:UDP-N-acetylmuramate dehydrogenase
MLPEIKQNIPLKDYSTMRLGGPARFLCEITQTDQIPAVIEWADAQGVPFVMIGGGSNIVWSDQGYPGVVMVNKLMGYELQDQGEAQYLIVGAGENWDSVVARSVEAGLSGLEQLSLIPGSAGATPIQNVGAYGREVADVMVCVQVYDIVQKKVVVLPKSECGFGYRTSRFKTTDKGKFLVTSITFALSTAPPSPPFYSSVEDYLKTNGLSEISSGAIREAVIAIRSAKLPDPAVVANCGSFFHNPIIPMLELERIKNENPNIVYWPVSDDEAKVSAGWLLEQLGLKGYHEPNTGMAIWDKQALVFVNEKATKTAQLLAFRDAIVQSVKDKYGISLVQEPELI